MPDSSAARSTRAALAWDGCRTMRVAAAVILGAWLLVGLALTLQPARPAPGQIVEHNLVPLRTIGIYLAHADEPFWIRQALGNLALLLPVGLLGPLALPRMLDTWWRAALAALALSLAVELIQLAIPNRSSDVDDVLVNVAGALLGYGVWATLRRAAGR